MDLESQPKPESEFMSLIIQTKYLFSSMDLESQPKPLSKLISCGVMLMDPTNSDAGAPDEHELALLVQETMRLKPEPELVSLIYQIFSLVIYMAMDSKDENLISLRPQAEVVLGDDNIVKIDYESQHPFMYDKWACLLNIKQKKFRIAGEGASSYVLCRACEGQNHENVTDKIKHPLHPKHSLRLVSYLGWYGKHRKCYCCDEYLSNLLCCCFTCDFAMNMACVEKRLVLSIDRPKRHEHPLALFPRTTSLICDVCALVSSSCPINICPPCGFVVHQTCIDLPRVIRISRHPHRISFTPSFKQGNWSCYVCRTDIHNDYGGYSCTNNSCSYAAHSKCATRRNIWDGEELEGVPEDEIEDIQPFVRISNGIIQHFSHKDHHLRLDENTDREYDENKLCQACITPIYSGNLYACMQCDYILHEECGNCPRKMYHPVHPHMLTLVQQDGNEKRRNAKCSACPWYCTFGLCYECPRERCSFKVHLPCSLISEPLVHASHMHPLYLTSQPGKKRECSVCKQLSRFFATDETFNCIECDFSLCFGCATLPQKLRYKHDKHMLVLSYGETSTMTAWCEVCEGEINTEKGCYTCDEYCCVTLHIECTIGNELYMKPGSSWLYGNCRVDVVRNKQKMTRPTCSYCKRYSPNSSLHIYDMEIRSIFCSRECFKRNSYLEDTD